MHYNFTKVPIFSYIPMIWDGSGIFLYTENEAEPEILLSCGISCETVMESIHGCV